MGAKHTPGPWAWFGNRNGGIYLATTHSGRKYVMGFRRYGMNCAQPVFRCNDRMVPAAELVEFQVGDGTARGFKEAASDSSVYRYDVSGIDNADACLIAAAPESHECTVLLDSLCAWLLHRFGPDSPEGREASARQAKARIAIAKAQGDA